MDTLPQPHHAIRLANAVNIITLACGNDTWKPPKTLHPTVQTIKQAVTYKGDIYAIDDHGELLPTGRAIILQKIKKEKAKVTQIAVIGDTLAFVLETKVLFYRGQFEEVYTGPSIEIYPGYGHAFLKTPTGYKFYGNNVKKFLVNNL